MRIADLDTLDSLVARAVGLVAASPGSSRCLLGVVGAPGSGKSTLVEQLLPALAARAPDGLGPDWVAHLPMDGFHLADAQLDRLGRRARKGAPDTFDVGGYAAMLRRVRTELDQPVYVPGFERELEQPLAAALVIAPPARLVVTEGNYLLHQDDGWSAISPLLDECWYVDLPDRVRHGRLVRRHVQFGKSPAAAQAWVDSVDQPNARLVERGRARATVVLQG